MFQKMRNIAPKSYHEINIWTSNQNAQRRKGKGYLSPAVVALVDWISIAVISTASAYREPGHKAVV